MDVNEKKYNILNNSIFFMGFMSIIWFYYFTLIWLYQVQKNKIINYSGISPQKSIFIIREST